MWSVLRINSQLAIWLFSTTTIQRRYHSLNIDYIIDTTMKFIYPALSFIKPPTLLKFQIQFLILITRNWNSDSELLTRSECVSHPKFCMRCTRLSVVITFCGSSPSWTFNEKYVRLSLKAFVGHWNSTICTTM